MALANILNFVKTHKQDKPNLIRDGAIDELAYPVGNYLYTNIGKIKRMAELILQHIPQENLILLGRGTSGALIGGIIGSIINKNYYQVRKEHDNCHGSKYYPIYDGYNIVIVDDLVSTGATINAIVNDLKRRMDGEFTPNIHLIVSGSVMLTNIPSEYFTTIIAECIYES